MPKKRATCEERLLAMFDDPRYHNEVSRSAAYDKLVRGEGFTTKEVDDAFASVSRREGFRTGYAETI